MIRLSSIQRIVGLTLLLFVSGCTKPSWTFDYSGGEKFSGKLKAEGLKANTGYVLCINGKSGQPGNDILYRSYQKNGDEGYYDFKQVQSDNGGNLETVFALELPKGKYDVKFALKELPHYKWIEISSVMIFEMN